MREIHITHNDADAVGCSVVANMNPHRKFKNDTYFCSIGEPDRLIPKLLDETEEVISWILITDLSISEETATLLDDYAKIHNTRVQLFDHHETNTLSRPWAFIKTYQPDGTQTSATKILYNAWREDIAQEYLEVLYSYVEEVRRYDIWEWKTDPLNYTEEYTNILIKQYGIHAAADHIFDSMVKNMKPFSTTDMEVIDAYKDKRDRVLKYVDGKTVICDFNEYVTAMLICSDNFFNEEMEYIYQNHEDVDIVMGLFPSSRTLSFRTSRDDVNLARFAKRLFGGGGHKKASGAKLDTKAFIDVISKYYQLLDIAKATEAASKNEDASPEKEDNNDKFSEHVSAFEKARELFFSTKENEYCLSELAKEIRSTINSISNAFMLKKSLVKYFNTAFLESVNYYYKSLQSKYDLDVVWEYVGLAAINAVRERMKVDAEFEQSFSNYNINYLDITQLISDCCAEKSAEGKKK